ncbi:predicted protein [Verticillium alfalfae VaMs.102]|uniref:Predicted protein n=1 Tax=Verticillium alfalfae (strain VaMs.102 / ATCC MYA-4576 / FGSC 10136) TaxID=526221 RepID=C9SKK7_VERA1|nr:predicted protein [Verticillium alfalfae VaMs.102]EEY19225.1 predicted protein [Verticillium alfalfae VaMs.102]
MFWSSDAEGDAVVRLALCHSDSDDAISGLFSTRRLLDVPWVLPCLAELQRWLHCRDPKSPIPSPHLSSIAIPITQRETRSIATSQRRDTTPLPLDCTTVAIHVKGGETGNLLARWPGSNKCLVISMAGVNAKKAHVTMIEWPSLGFHYPIFAKEKLQRLQRRPSPGGVNMRAGERVSSVHPDGVVFAHRSALTSHTGPSVAHPPLFHGDPDLSDESKHL